MRGPYSYSPAMTITLIGYARCSTNDQDLTAQKQALENLGVPALKKSLSKQRGKVTRKNRRRRRTM